MKLGRTLPKQVELFVEDYLNHEALPPPPPAVDYTLAMTGPWGMMKNDRLGDCTCAGQGHAVQTVTANNDGLITPTDDEVVKMYEEAMGYNPNDPRTDRGGTLAAASAYMYKTGLHGVKVDAYANIDHTSIAHAMNGISIFGGIYIGVLVTKNDMQAFELHRGWTNPSLAGIEGGHALWVPKYDANGIYVVTWGELQFASWDWFNARCDEAIVLVYKPWVENTLKETPDGLRLNVLLDDMKSL